MATSVLPLKTQEVSLACFPIRFQERVVDANQWQLRSFAEDARLELQLPRSNLEDSQQFAPPSVTATFRHSYIVPYSHQVGIHERHL